MTITGGMRIGGVDKVRAELTIVDNNIPTVRIENTGSIYEGNAAGARANFKIRVLEEMERPIRVKLLDHRLRCEKLDQLGEHARSTN